MLYFSEVKGKKVLTEDNVEIGKLDDLIFLASTNPLITKLVVKNKLQEEFLIPISYIHKMNKDIYLKKGFQTNDLSENEIYINKNLVDTQIIDLKGNKVVRVNDVAIQDKDNLMVFGIDIGFLGILRWFYSGEAIVKTLHFLGLKPAPKFLSWGDVQPLELAKGKVILKKNEERLKNLRPEDLADYLEKTNIANTRKMLKILDKNLAKEVIESFNVNYQISLFHTFKSDRIIEWLNLIDDDEAVDILLTFSKKKRTEIINALDKEKQKKVLYLLEYTETAIGSLLIADYMTVKPTNTVREVINRIKKETGDYYYFNDVYVVNDMNQLIGVFNLHELIISDIDAQVYKFMHQKLILLYLTTPKGIALRKFLKYRLHVLPVIDFNRKILGVVAIDDLSNLIKQK